MEGFNFLSLLMKWNRTIFLYHFLVIFLNILFLQDSDKTNTPYICACNENRLGKLTDKD